MKMKNVCMLLLGAMLVLSMIGTGTADTAQSNPPIIVENSDSTTGTTNVTLTLSQYFEVILPADFDLTADGNGNFTGLANVSADVKRLSAGKILTISMTSDANPSGNIWKLTNTTGSDTLDYVTNVSTSKEGGVNVNDENTWYTAGTPIITIDTSEKQEKWIHFQLIGTPMVVGTYKDMLIFNIEVQ